MSRTTRRVLTAAAAAIALGAVFLAPSPESGAAAPAIKGAEAHDSPSACAECWLPFF